MPSSTLVASREQDAEWFNMDDVMQDGLNTVIGCKNDSYGEPNQNAFQNQK